MWIIYLLFSGLLLANTGRALLPGWMRSPELCTLFNLQFDVSQLPLVLYSIWWSSEMFVVQ
jgi:hypothetical protein